MSVTVWPAIFAIREISKVLLLHGQHAIASDGSMDHVDDFIEQFKKKGVSFCCLYHHEEEDKTGQVKAPLINEMNDLASEDTPDSSPETECLSAKIQLDDMTLSMQTCLNLLWKQTVA
jgi:hypothetical protein